MRFTITYLIIFFVTSLLYSNEVKIVSSDILEYPERQVEFYYYNDNNDIIKDLTNKVTQLKVNGIAVNNFDFIEPTNFSGDSISVVFSIDISDQNSSNLELIRNAINEIAKFSLKGKIKFAIQVYNTQSYILQNFTNNIVDINRALNLLISFDVSNYNIGFLSLNTGSIDIAKHASSKSIIINLTQGNSIGDSNSISNSAIVKNIPIYNFVFNNLISDNLRGISNLTNGAYYENNNSENLFNRLLYIINKSANIESYKINYTDNNCDFFNNITILANSVSSVTFKSIYNQSKFPYLELKPTELNFGIVPSGSNKIDSFMVTAKNLDIELNNIITVPSEFEITPDYKNILIEKNTSKLFKIKLKSNTTDYKYTKLQLISDACLSTNLEIVSGSNEGNVGHSELKLLYPNGSEIFYSGELINILWDGVIDSQSVILEYSTDNGIKWNLITENAKNKTFQWRIPNLQSDQMLLRVEVPKGTLKYNNVDYVIETEQSKKIRQAILSQDKNYAGVSFDDGSLFIWDIKNSKLKRQLRDKNIDIQNIDISFAKSNNLFAASFGKTNEYNVVVWDAENAEYIKSRQFNLKPNKLDWTNDGINLYIGFDNGELAIWNLVDDKISIINKFGNNINLLSINTKKGIIALTSNSNIIFTDLLGDSLSSINLSDKILDIDWNPSGDKISILYDFTDLRIFNIINENGNLTINQDSRILRNGLPNLTNAEWINNNSIILSSIKNNLIEYWGIDGTKIFDIDLHKKPINTIFANGTLVISSQDTNFAMVWDINNYPFTFKTMDSDNSDNTWSIVKKEIQTQKILLEDLCLNFPYYFEIDDIYKNLNEPSIKIDSISTLTKEITILNEFPLILKNGENLHLKINYTPTRKGTYENSLFVYHGAVRDTIVLRNRNITPDVSILKKNIVFENSLINSNESKTEYILQYTGTNQIKFDSLTILFGGDVFKVLNSNYDSVSSSERLFIDIQFLPKSKGSYSGLIKLTSKQLCSPLFISLYGNGVEPIIEYNNNLDFGLVQCNSQADTTIFIKNLSLNSLEIKSSQLIGADNIFVKNDKLPVTLNTNDSVGIDLSFKKSDIGSFNSQLEISTNLVGKYEKLLVNILAVRDSNNLEFLDEKLDFGTIANGQNPTKNIKIINNSEIKYKFNIPLIFKEFELVNATPIEISKGDTSLLTFQYIGNDLDTNINILFPIGNSCNSMIEIPINIAISGGKSHIQYEENINIGTVNCDDRVYFNHQITNSGTSNLVINKINFSGKNANDFRLEADYSNISILPSKSLELNFSYLPSDEGLINSNMVIESNAENSILGQNIINISGEYMRTSILISPDTLRYEGLRSNRKYSKSITIRNNGSTVITPKFTNDINFIVDSIRPTSIQPNEESKAYITFLGGSINTTYDGNILFLDECNQQNSLNLIAEVGGSDFVSLQPEEIVSTTGSLVNINIKFENTSDISIPLNDTIQTKLLFNSTLLVPIEDKYKGIINNNGEREISLKFPLQDKPYIYHIQAVVTLGDTSYSNIRLEQSTHLTNSFYIDDFKQGSITITNIVRKPTDRFINGNGHAYLSETFPNPLTDVATIKYGVIESTNVNISIYDILGNKVLEILNKYHTPGEYSIKINPQSLASGNYLYKLETPSMEIIKKMTIIR